MIKFQVAAIDFNRLGGSGLPRRSAAKAGEPPRPIGWDDIRRIIEEGGWINMHPPAKKETA